MPFKVRDLVITLLPPGFERFAEEGPCDAGSEHPPGPPDPPPPPGPDSIAFSRPEIEELRLVLQLALTQLGGPLRREDLRPRKLADLHVLEERLVQALDEVRQLQRKMGVAGLK